MTLAKKYPKFPPPARPGDVVAVSPDDVGPSGANISRRAKYSG
jgi:hypothetical protein